jgi:hypothetical protein
MTRVLHGRIVLSTALGRYQADAIISLLRCFRFDLLAADAPPLEEKLSHSLKKCFTTSSPRRFAGQLVQASALKYNSNPQSNMKSSTFSFPPSVHVTTTPVAQITRVTSSAGGVAGAGGLGGIALVRDSCSACCRGWWPRRRRRRCSCVFVRMFVLA